MAGSSLQFTVVSEQLKEISIGQEPKAVLRPNGIKFDAQMAIRGARL
jgi:hypothetical protein